MHIVYVRALTISSAYKILYSWGYDGIILKWTFSEISSNVSSKYKQERLLSFNSIKRLALTPNSKFIAVVNGIGHFHIIDTKTLKEMIHFSDNNNNILSFSFKKNLIAITLSNLTLRIYKSKLFCD